jgi:hypothetical protein
MNSRVKNPLISEKTAVRRRNARRAATFFCVFWYALLGGLRFYETLKYQAYLAELNIWPRPLYMLLSGLLIGLGFSLALFCVAFRMRCTPLYIRALGSVFLAWLWFDVIWLGTREAFYHNLPVTGLISAATLLVMFALVKPYDYFREEKDGNQ